MRRIIVPVAVLVGTAGLIPFALIAKARVETSDKPRIHIIHDMDNQPKYKAQAESQLFLDDRAMRQPVPGTVARGELLEDDHLYRGQVVRDGKKVWAETFPGQVTVDMALLKRGQERFNIYCAMCHGYAGGGDGMVHQRVTKLKTQGADGVGGWTTPANLRAEQIAAQPVGQLYNTIANGKNTMPPYGAQVSVRDRWAIVAYVRALQQKKD